MRAVFPPLSLHDGTSLARVLWERIPPRWRRELGPLVAGLQPVPILRRDNRATRYGFTVAGFFRHPTGIGEGARLQADALSAMGIPVERLDLSPLIAGGSLPAPGAGAPCAGAPLIVHANPPLFARALAAMGPEVRRGRNVVGYWVWELEEAPRSWVKYAAEVDEVWAPSRFAAEAIARAIRRPVRVVTHPVAAAPFATTEASARERLEVLSFANLHSTMARKNPLAAIRAFRDAFPHAGDAARLTLKLDGAEAYAADAAAVHREAAASGGSVRVMEGDLSRAARDALVGRADVVLSLHRAEGFGLTLAEALCAGRQVIATGWSGNMDFMTPANSVPVSARLVPVRDPGGTFRRGRWAEPDHDAAVAALRAARAPRPPQTPPAFGIDFMAAIGEVLTA